MFIVLVSGVTCDRRTIASTSRIVSFWGKARDGAEARSRVLRKLKSVTLGIGLLSLVEQGAAEGKITDGTLGNLYAALIGGGLVKFECNATNQLPAEFPVTADTIIDATDRTVVLKGGDSNRIFNVHPNVTLTLVNVTLSSGHSPQGGAILNDGGSIIATNCTFSGNSAKGAAGADGATGQSDVTIGKDGGDGSDGVPARGGAIYSSGNVTLTRCKLISNKTGGGNGGKGGAGGVGSWKGGNGGHGGSGGDAEGGAIYSTQDLGLDGCLIEGNAATGGNAGAGGDAGAGAWPAASGNGGYGAKGAGGAIFVLGRATLLNCAFVTNSVAGGKSGNGQTDENSGGVDGRAGGDSLGGSVYNEGTVTVVNCTFHSNSAAGGGGGDGGAGSIVAGDGGNGGNAFGGGLCNIGAAAVTNCTFATNLVAGGVGGAAGTGGWTAPSAGNNGALLGGNLCAVSGSVALKNTILAYGGAGKDAYGSITDAGHNLCSDDSLQPHGQGTRNSTDPLLSSLTDSGGPTKYLLPPFGSPAVDGAEAVAGLATDQRGIPRPQGAAWDIGAVERQTLLLSGHVLRGNTPLPGLSVSMYALDGRSWTATTDDQGQYAFLEPGVGSFWIWLPDGQSVFYPTKQAVQLTATNLSFTNLDFLEHSETLSIARSNSAKTVLLTGIPGLTYRIFGSTNLVQWHDIITAKTDTNGMAQFLDTNTVKPDRRFYRSAYP